LQNLLRASFQTRIVMLRSITEFFINFIIAFRHVCSLDLKRPVCWTYPIDFFVKLPETKLKFLKNFPRKSNFLWNCLKIEILLKCAMKNQFYWWNCLKKSKFFGNLLRKSKYFVKLPKKSKFFGNLTWKIEIFCEITWKKPKFFGNFPWKIDFLWNYLKESKFFGNFPRKSNFFTRVHDPQILNQIDAAAQTYLYEIKLAYLLLLANIGLFKWNHLTVASFSVFNNHFIYLGFLFNGWTFQHLKVSRPIISASTRFYMRFGV